MKRLQYRIATAAEFTSKNPILAKDEIGIERDTGKEKIGDGTSQWSALSYFADSATDSTKVLKTGDTMTGDLNMSGTQKVINLANGSASGDAINKGQLDAVAATAGAALPKPGSSTDNAIVRWDGTSGSAVQNSGVTIDDSNGTTIPGSLTVSNSSGGRFMQISAATSSNADLNFATAGSNRWSFRKSSDAESGSNVGSNFVITRRDDSGSQLSLSLIIWRNTGKVTFGDVGTSAGLEFGSSGPRLMVGTGSAEGAVSAPVGSEWKRTDGQTQFKEAGTGNTGWVVPSPTGALTAFAGSTAPQGWLLCYGQAVSRTTYANLFAVIGTTYGTGDGSTTFNLPDLRGRTVAGLDNMGGTDAGRLTWQNVLGTVGVSSTTVDSGEQQHTLSAAESGVPAHSHGITDPGHNHDLYQISGAGSAFAPNYSMGTAVTAYAATVPNTTGITVNNNSAAAASAAHNNMQPTMLLNWIIRT